jgi:cytochrome P450
MTAIPGPPNLVAWSTLQWFRRPYAFMEECHAKYGDVFTFKLLGLPPLVVFSNPEHVKEVFQDDGETMLAGKFNRSLAPLLGDTSVLMADGRAHTRKRKLLLPPFHGERMARYGADMIDITEQKVAEMPRHRPFPLHAVMQDITLEVIVRTVFGISAGPKFDEVVANMKEILELGANPALLLPFMQFEAGGRSPYGRFRATVRRGDAFLYEEMKRRRATGERGSDILSLLLDAKDEEGKTPSDEELRDELVTLLVAGHETTATGLTWAVRWLLADPALFAEVRDAVDTLGPDPTPEAISKSELLDATVREALRLVPVIPLVGRILDKPMRLGGYDLPAETAIVCSIYLAQRRAAAYPNPAEFDPRRFLGKKFSAYEFYPFGGGVRRCIGMAFALYEMKMVLARFFALVDARLAQDSFRQVRRSITITPERGLLVSVRDRASRERSSAA